MLVIGTTSLRFLFLDAHNGQDFMIYRMLPALSSAATGSTLLLDCFASVQIAGLSLHRSKVFGCGYEDKDMRHPVCSLTGIKLDHDHDHDHDRNAGLL